MAWFQFDEINGVFNGLQVRGAKAVEVRRQRGRARIERIIHAAGWCRVEYLRSAWEYIADSSDDPDAHFGPVLVLLALDPHNPRVEALLASLPRSVARTLSDLGLWSSLTSHRRRT